MAPVEEQGIEPHVTVIDKSERTDDTFSRSDFIYDHEKDVYICPAGKMIESGGAGTAFWPQWFRSTSQR